MKRKNIYILFVLILSLHLYANISPTLAKDITYSPTSATTYASQHCSTATYNHEKYKCWDPKNEMCENYNQGGGTDCANFMSQSLISGGITFYDCLTGKGKKAKAGELVDGAVVIGKDGKTKGIKLANDLVTALKNSYCFKELSSSNESKAGDIVINKSSSGWVTHVTMVADPIERYYYGHTRDRCSGDTACDDLKTKEIEKCKYSSSATVLQFPEEKCKKCEIDEKTCKAEMKDKATICETCDSITGKLTPKCQDIAGGRCGSRVNCDTQTGMCITSPAGNICADDTFTVGTGISPQPVPSVSASATVGILGVGYTYDMYGLLQSFNEDARVIRPGDLSPELVKDMPILIIPSAGLYGMENSDFFKAALEEYVKQGGNILVLSQQNGQAFSVIPGGLGGYGWVEDQHCQTNSSYIDTWHPVLAGQTRSTPSLNVDGYFTKYPENTIILLRRMINGQPAVLMYPYGNGYVIAATIYTDNAYARGEASSDERGLIRDIVAWAKTPMSLIESKQGETITINLPIKNGNDIFTSVGVDIVFYDPDGNFIKRDAKIPLQLNPGESAVLPITYTIPQDAKVGIYQIKHELYTEDWILWPSEENPDGDLVWMDVYFHGTVEEPSGRFIVNNPPTTPVQIAQLTFSIQSDSETYAYGSNATFTIVAFNNSDTEKTIIAKGEFGSQILVVPAKGSSSFTYSKIVYGQGWFAVSFSNENNTFLSSRSKTYFVYWPYVNVTTQTDKTLYSKGETVSLAIDLQNKQSVAYATTLKIRVSDQSNSSIYSNTIPVMLAAGGISSQTLQFVLPMPAGGFYIVSAEVYDSFGRKIGNDSISFESPLSQISVAPSLPSSLNTGSNTFAFVLNNTGKIRINSGSLDVSLKDPDQNVIYTGKQSFSIGIGESKTLNVPIAIPSIKFGNYTLTYTQSDEIKTGKPTSLTIPNTATIALSFDKSSYRIRETANLTATITNTGKFNLENASVTVSVPDAGYSNTQTVSVSGIGSQFTYSIPIPETTTAGQHNLNVTLALPSGSSITQTSKFTVPESSLIIGYPGSTTLNAGDTINLTIENTGGVDTNYATEKLIIIDAKGVVIYQGNASGTVLVGEKKALLNIQIPSQAVNGVVFLIIEIKDNKTSKLASLYRTFEITGLTATLQTKTDKLSYLTTEAIKGMTNLANGQYGIEGGSLKVSVMSWTKGASQSYQFVDKFGSLGRGDNQFVYPISIAVDDSRIYVADSSRLWYVDNERIKIYSKVPPYTYLGQFGSAGSGDGQFDNLFDIAVDSNYIYVTSDNRVQIFNKSTYAFVGKFGGSYGSGDGQFMPLEGIAIDDNFIYLSSYNDKRIQIFNKTSPYAFVGKFTHDSFEDAESIAVDNSFIYVTDVYKTGVYIFNKTSPYAFVAHFGPYGTGINNTQYPTGIKSYGNYLYIADQDMSGFKVFNKTTYTGVIAVGSYGSGDGQFSDVQGIDVDADRIYVADSWNSRIQIFNKEAGGSFKKHFETTIPIIQSANASRKYTTDIGTLNATGKLYLIAELKNALGQTIATAEHPFYIIEGKTLLLFATDKKVYKPGETVTITGEVKNLATITASALSLQLSANGQNIYTATFDVPAKGSRPFTVTTTAGSEGSYTLTGKVIQNNSMLVEINDQYEVAKPKVTATVTIPEVAGNEPFNINVEMKNEGKVAATIDARFMMQNTSIDLQTLTIPAGEKRVVQYQQRITTNTAYAFTFTGDLNQTITKSVAYGLRASVNVNASSVYPEGKIAIPVTITNTGQLDLSVEVNFQLSNQQSAVGSQNKTYYIPKGGSVNDTLYYDLTEGNYTLTASSQYSAVGSQANFFVRKENKVEMTISAGAQTSNLLPVTVNLTNAGFNNINGSCQLSVVNGQGATIWRSSQDISQLLSHNSQLLTFNINTTAIASGEYTLKAELLNNSNQQIRVSSQPLAIKGAVFQITQLPSYQTFTVGQEASFTFKVKNTGNQEGAFDFNFKSYDLINANQTEWLMAGEEKTISFSFMLPQDIEEKDYFADYELKDSKGQSIRGQIKYRVAGINLNVSASLDKQYYNTGDTARLTINVQTPTSNPQPLFARVNYAGYESQQSFTLNGSQTLTFNIPLTQITGEKLFYGIYHESGRSIHLNSLYIYKAGDVITIKTDKQVYNPGEQVLVTVNSVSGTSGTLILTAPNYSETFVLAGTAAKSFTLPATMTAGTYNIGYQFTANGSQLSGNYPFDIAGIQVKVTEATLDKAKYASSDTLKLSLAVESNQNISAMLKTWIVDPQGKYTSAGESSINLSSSEPLLFTSNSQLVTLLSGIHRLVYGIYSGDLLMVSGSEAFDVGDAVLLGISTDKTDYPAGNETVSVSVSVFGTVTASLELLLDGISVKNESVALNGFSNLNIQLGTVKLGTHTLKGIVTAGGLKSTKETSFVYGSSLPDLITAITSQSSVVSKENMIKITASVTNQGMTSSNVTIVSLYDGDNLIETKTINALNSGGSQDIPFIWNVLGKAGEHSIKVIADPLNTITEFNEENNTAKMDLIIPDIALVTETDKNTYKIRQMVNISSTITNLTSAKTYNNLTLITSIVSPTGEEAYRNTTPLSAIMPSGVTAHTEVWNTAGLSAEGAYTITQKVISDSQLITQNSGLVTLLKTADFTLKTDTDYRKIKQGERATYTVYLEPVNGWNSDIALSIEGLPAGASASFTPGSLVPPGESLALIITTDATPAGALALTLGAEGTDEGEMVKHTLPLKLDVSGFGLNSTEPIKTVKQLEAATFEIDINSLNGYEGQISLSVAGVPYGIRASFDNTGVQAPGKARLTALTSKYVRAGTYTITITGSDGLVRRTLNLNLAILPNPEIVLGIIATQGPGPQNTATVRLISREFIPLRDITAFDSTYGANAVMADIDGDGYDEIVVSQGPGPNNPAALKVFKRNGTLMSEYTAFDTKYGLTLSAGDIDGDWRDELIVGMGPDPKNPASLKILKWNGNGFTEVINKIMYDDLKYGLNVAAGDVDGDGQLEIITAPGPGSQNPATIKIWKQNGQSLTEINAFTAFEEYYGANIAAGDIDRDGKAEIIVGAGPDPKNPAIVRVYKADGTLVVEFRPYDPQYGYGVTTASGDIDGDGIDEIITGLGPGTQSPSWVRIFKGDGTLLSNGFLAYPEDIKYGVKMSGGNTGK